MARRIRSILKTLVVLCEGEKTEPYYLEQLKNYVGKKTPFDNIAIYPEIKTKAIKHTGKEARPVKKLKKGGDDIRPYIVKTEKKAADYHKFKSFPLRVVREAVLFKDENGSTEAWVVFDRDGHSKVEETFTYARENDIQIAFSARSLEEWFLCHFERNAYAFPKTICQQCDNFLRGKKDVKTHCNGDNCLVGRLLGRFMHDYKKNAEDVFVKYSVSNMRTAFINASWTRSPSQDKNIWERNPYTNFDRLIDAVVDEQIKNDLKINQNFKWFALNTELDLFTLKQKSEKYSLETSSEKNFSVDVIYWSPDFKDCLENEPVVLKKQSPLEIIFPEGLSVVEIKYKDTSYFYEKG